MCTTFLLRLRILRNVIGTARVPVLRWVERPFTDDDDDVYLCWDMGCRATFTNLFFIHGLVLLCFSIFNVLAQPASLSFSDCTSGDALAPALKINVSTVYGQIVTDSNLGRHLNLTVIGNTGQQIIPISNETGLLCMYEFQRNRRSKQARF